MSKKQDNTREKHFEIVGYTLHGVRVLVEIDYDKGTISLLDQPQRNATKKWVFAGRSLGYMAGWRNILKAMEYAITRAEFELQQHVDAEKKAHASLARKVMGEIAKEK
jgi:hypothetical protein